MPVLKWLKPKLVGGSATLSMGLVAACFGLSLVQVLQDEKGMVVCAYVEGDGKYVRFFAQPLLLQKWCLRTSRHRCPERIRTVSAN